MMDSRAIIAVILSVTLMFVLVGSSEAMRWLVGMRPEDTLTTPSDIAKVKENLLFAIVGALSAYIAKGKMND